MKVWLVVMISPLPVARPQRLDDGEGERVGAVADERDMAAAAPGREFIGKFFVLGAADEARIGENPPHRLVELVAVALIGGAEVDERNGLGRGGCARRGLRGRSHEDLRPKGLCRSPKPMRIGLLVAMDS